MCFSAGASFGAGAILTVIGVASVKKAQNPSQRIFAGIPAIFAVQQISEGFLWLALSRAEFAPMQIPATYVFLFFAQVVWPFWIPFSMLKLEKDAKRIKIGKLLLAVGAIVSLYLAYCLITYPVEAKIDGYHISYLQDYPKALGSYGGILYFIATVFSPFLSSTKKMWSLGAAIFISYVITAIFYTDYIISVWCFFAAIISVAVYALMFEVQRPADHTLAAPELKTAGG